MSAPTNHWKLGAFVLGSVLLGLLAVVLLAAQTLQVVTVTYTSYFDEAVTGLEVGSPITFRGVKIGNVSMIDVAPDRRHVEINYQLGVKVLRRLGLVGEGSGKETKIAIPSDIRVQIASTGLTGTKYLQIDYFDIKTAPLPELPFAVPENYIPATPSTMKNLEDAVVRAVDMIPQIAQELGTVVTRINGILDDVSQRGLPQRTAATLYSANVLMVDLKRTLDQTKMPQLSRETTAAMKNATAALGRMNQILDRLDGKAGLLASVQRSSDALGDMIGPQLSTNIDETGRDLRDAATAVRELVEALQRDPDMLLKGKAKVRR